MLAIVSPLIWSSLLDYQQQRVLTYFDSNVDPLGDGWNIAQSQTAIGSGGFFVPKITKSPEGAELFALLANN